MQLVSKAADSIAQGDLVDKAIRSGMNWSLLSSAAVFSFKDRVEVTLLLDLQRRAHFR